MVSQRAKKRSTFRMSSYSFLYIDSVFKQSVQSSSCQSMCVQRSALPYDNDLFPWHRGPRRPRASPINNVKSTTARFPGNCPAILYLHLSDWCLSCKLICLRGKKTTKKCVSIQVQPRQASMAQLIECIDWHSENQPLWSNAHWRWCVCTWYGLL